MLKEQAIKGLQWTSVASLAGNLLQLLQLVIVSRYIAAADYGLMALTLVIIYFCQLLGDMGLSNALVYKKNVSRLAFSSLFWCSVIFCWCIFALLLGIAPLLAVFFKQPQLTSVVLLTSASFIFLPLQMQYLALLKKELLFNRIAVGDIGAKIVALLVAVVMAVQGWGVFALVWSTLAGLATTAAWYFYWGSRKLRIGFQFSRSAVSDMLGFGLYQAGNELLNYFNFQSDTILLGRLLGIEAVGYYSFAKNLAIKPLQVINPVVTQVAYPLLVKINEQAAVVRSVYLKMIRYLSSVNFLVYPFIAALADTIIKLFFAEKWLPAAPALQALALYCMVRAVFNPVGVLLLAHGRVKQLFYWNLVLLALQPVVVYITAGYGVAPVALALALFFCALVLPMCIYLLQPVFGISAGMFWQSIRQPLLNAVLIFAVLYGYNCIPLQTVAVKFAGGVVLWVIISLLLTRFFNGEVYKESYALFRNQWRSARDSFKQKL
jgi:O-antigen/teichoic acid export membrane protein